MLAAIGKRASVDAPATARPRVQTMFEPSASSASLLSNGSSRGDGDLARAVDEFAEDADHHLDQALRNQETVTADIQHLMQLLRQVRFVPVPFLDPTLSDLDRHAPPRSARTSLSRQAWGCRTGSGSTR